MKHGSLFSGIGGFDLASEWMGWENVFHCEWNEFGKKVLKYYWPEAISYDDITKTDFTIHKGRIDIITGGFPCQPFSAPGKRNGTEDERYLWPEMLRAIREIQPRWVVGENVSGLVNWDGGLVFEQVQTDLEAEGYEVIPFLLPAAGVNAPHKRERVWFIANSNSNRLEGWVYKKECEISELMPEKLSCRQIWSNWENNVSKPVLHGTNDGIPEGLDRKSYIKILMESIKAYGNAVVPQVVYQIFKAIERYEKDQQ